VNKTGRFVGVEDNGPMPTPASILFRKVTGRLIAILDREDLVAALVRLRQGYGAPRVVM
jgi:hypothetical protein